jgi:large subunit ribosomal protein L9
MKVLFLKDVGGVGRAHTVKEVSDGYAQSFLIPRGLAVIATPEKIKQAEAAQKRKMEEKSDAGKHNKELAKLLHNSSITIPVKVNEKGHLFSSVDARLIVAALKEKHGVTIQETSCDLSAWKGHIKEVGAVTIPLVFGLEQCKIQVHIIRS